MRLLTLPKDVVAMLEEGSLSSGQARPLIGISNASSIAEEIVSKNYSARKVEYLTRSKKNKGEKVIDSNIIKTQERICLLYTSPSPRDRQKSRMPSSA